MSTNKFHWRQVEQVRAPSGWGRVTQSRRHHVGAQSLPPPQPGASPSRCQGYGLRAFVGPTWRKLSLKLSPAQGSLVRWKRHGWAEKKIMGQGHTHRAKPYMPGLGSGPERFIGATVVQSEPGLEIIERQ